MKSAKLTVALLALDALLAVALAALWLAPGAPARWRNWQAPAPQAPSLDDARAAQLAPSPSLRGDYPVIVQRPLFAADRKPHVGASDADAAAAPPPESIDQVRLYGIVDGPSAQGALLERDGQPQFVRRGDKVGDWTLQAIDGRDATFAKDEQRRTLSLPDSLTLPASAPAAASAPATSAAPAFVSATPGGLPRPPAHPVPPRHPPAPGTPRTLPHAPGF